MGQPPLMLSVFVWERFSPRLFILWVRLCAVAFIEGVLPHSSTYPFKLDIVAFMFQVGRLGLRKCNVLQVEARAATTMYHTAHFSSAQTPCLSAQTSFSEALCSVFAPGCAKTLWLFCCCSCFIGWSGQDHHHPLYKWSTNHKSVHHMLKTAQVLSRRPCHMALISVCFVCWFVLRQGQALDPALPMWDHGHTDPYSVW